MTDSPILARRVASFAGGSLAARRVASLAGGSLAALASLLGSPLALLAQEEHAEEGSAATQLFSVDLGLSLWTLVIFALLVAVLWKFAWGPILEAVNAREDAIRRDLEAARKERDEAKALLEEHRKQLAEARRQAQAIIAEGREAGEDLRRQIEEKARDEGQRMVEGARREIDREKESAIDEIRREATDLALAAASKLVGERLDADRDRELVMGYLDRVQKDEGSARA